MLGSLSGLGAADGSYVTHLNQSKASTRTCWTCTFFFFRFSTAAEIRASAKVLQLQTFTEQNSRFWTCTMASKDVESHTRGAVSAASKKQKAAIKTKQTSAYMMSYEDP